MEKDDQKLVEDYLRGDDEAFAALMRRYLKPVYNFIFRLVKNVQSAEDATQETFFKVWKNLKKYRRQESFKAWIFAIARNTAIDLLRKKKQFVFSDFERPDGENPLIDTLADTEPLPDDIIKKTEDKKILDSALEKLPPQYQEVLLLYYSDDFTFDDIGKIIKTPLNTVKSQHRRALIMLKKILLMK